MAKIFVFGNEETAKWSEQISESMFIQLSETNIDPKSSINEDGERKICEFIIKNISEDVKAFIIDVDRIANSELCLTFAMAIRLSIFELKHRALAPIYLMSKMKSDIFYYYKYSSIILTKYVFIDSPELVVETIDTVNPLTAEEYQNNFLNIIKIIPNAKEGRHSLANQWGADVLNRIMFGGETNNELIKKARLSLYFRYVQALSLKLNDIELLIQGQNQQSTKSNLHPIEAKGKKILLIDDEADKGWSDVLQKLLPNSELKTIQEQVPDYESLSNEAKRTIESGKYDLIFLDLRMNGINEEATLNTMDFSGMKILKEIKKLNKGNQVIMFTASNKAWNMKALLDAGADGYYIKESPEFVFPTSYSENNINELCKLINICLNNGYLRQIYNKIKRIKELIHTSVFFEDREEEILGSIDVAFDLLSRSYDNNEFKAYSYLQLFLAIEEFVNSSILFDLTEKDLYLYNDKIRYRILKDKKQNKENKDYSYDSIICMKNGQYVLKRGKYTNRFIDTNFRVSTLLIFKFNKENSSVLNWTKIYLTRNKKAAHPKSELVTINDFNMILDFMLFFFDESKSNWREVNDAFPDVNPEEQLALLQSKYNKNYKN